MNSFILPKIDSDEIRIDGNINQMANRKAMGLKDYFTPMRFDSPKGVINELRMASPGDWVSVLQGTVHSLEERYAAGQLLALLGDPRINTYAPVMKTIPGARVRLGLHPDCVDKVVARYRHLGVLREWIEKETPQYYATVSTFRMAIFPVTHQEYRDYLLCEPGGEIPSSWIFGRYPQHLANHPVATVSEQAAASYAHWLSQKTGRHFRLPTEQEWEYAAAGPDGLEFPWGNRFERHRANTAELGLYASTPVGMFIEGSSPFGIMDMAGNVEEYTSSDYWTYPGGQSVRDDLLETRGRYKVARGGSFTRFADLARCRRRHGRYQKDIYIMGFRLAEEPDDSSVQAGTC